MDEIEATDELNLKVLESATISTQSYDLAGFIDKYTGLIESLGVFVALTVFTQTFGPKYPSDFLSFITLLISAVLFIELRRAFPVGLRFPFSVDDSKTYALFLYRNYRNRMTQFAVLLDISLFSLIGIAFWEYKLVAISFAALAAIATLVYGTYNGWKQVTNRFAMNPREIASETIKRSRARSRTILPLISSIIGLAIIEFIARSGNYSDEFIDVFRRVASSTVAISIVATIVVFLFTTSLIRRVRSEMRIAADQALTIRLLEQERDGYIQMLNAASDEQTKRMARDRLGMVQRNIDRFHKFNEIKRS